MRAAARLLFRREKIQDDTKGWLRDLRTMEQVWARRRWLVTGWAAIPSADWLSLFGVEWYRSALMTTISMYLSGTGPSMTSHQECLLMLTTFSQLVLKIQYDLTGFLKSVWIIGHTVFAIISNIFEPNFFRIFPQLFELPIIHGSYFQMNTRTFDLFSSTNH